MRGSLPGSRPGTEVSARHNPGIRRQPRDLISLVGNHRRDPRVRAHRFPAVGSFVGSGAQRPPVPQQNPTLPSPSGREEGSATKAHHELEEEITCSCGSVRSSS